MGHSDQDPSRRGLRNQRTNSAASTGASAARFETSSRTSSRNSRSSSSMSLSRFSTLSSSGRGAAEQAAAGSSAQAAAALSASAGRYGFRTARFSERLGEALEHGTQQFRGLADHRARPRHHGNLRPRFAVSAAKSRGPRSPGFTSEPLATGTMHGLADRVQDWRSALP